MPNITTNHAITYTNILWRYQICIAKCLYSYRDDLPKNLFKITAEECKKSTSGLRLSLKKVVAKTPYHVISILTEPRIYYGKLCK